MREPPKWQTPAPEPIPDESHDDLDWPGEYSQPGDTPEFNSLITRLKGEGSQEEAERIQKRGWVKERPSRMRSDLTTKIVERARDGAHRP
jgi:hypothetical protein